METPTREENREGGLIPSFEQTQDVKEPTEAPTEAPVEEPKEEPKEERTKRAK